MTPLPLEPPVLPSGSAAAAESGAGLEPFVGELLRAVLDCIQGRRSITQLTRWVDDEVYADVALRARLHQRNPVPLSVRSFRLQPVGDHAIEVSARIRRGPRYAAVALRLERLGERWVCRIADFGPLASPVPDPPPRLSRVAPARTGTGQRLL